MELVSIQNNTMAPQYLVLRKPRNGRDARGLQNFEETKYRLLPGPNPPIPREVVELFRSKDERGKPRFPAIEAKFDYNPLRGESRPELEVLDLTKLSRRQIQELARRTSDQHVLKVLLGHVANDPATREVVEEQYSACTETLSGRAVTSDVAPEKRHRHREKRQKHGGHR